MPVNVKHKEVVNALFSFFFDTIKYEKKFYFHHEKRISTKYKYYFAFSFKIITLISESFAKLPQPSLDGD